MNPTENSGKVSSNINNYFFKQGPNNARYKTTLCRHYNTPQGCSYGDKCQFAHGEQELRQVDKNMMFANPMQSMNNKQKNALNYKIVKCKNWEKDKSCKYGAHCTFAHGDEEMRNKADNLYQMQPMMFQPFMMNPMMPMGSQFQGMDMTQMGMAPMMMGLAPMMNGPNNVPQQENKEQI